MALRYPRHKYVVERSNKAQKAWIMLRMMFLTGKLKLAAPPAAEPPKQHPLPRPAGTCDTVGCTARGAVPTARVGSKRCLFMVFG